MQSLIKCSERKSLDQRSGPSAPANTSLAKNAGQHVLGSRGWHNQPISDSFMHGGVPLGKMAFEQPDSTQVRLTLEAGQPISVVGEFGRQDFDGHFAAHAVICYRIWNRV